MKSKRASRAEGDEKEKGEEEGKAPSIAVTATDSSALAMISCRITSSGLGEEGLRVWSCGVVLALILIFEDLAMVNSGTSMRWLLLVGVDNGELFGHGS